MDSKDIRGRHHEFLFPAVKNYYNEPLVITEGKGAVVKDLDGQSYQDFFGGILTVSLGHANDEVNGEVIAQVNRLTHISTLYPTLPIVELAGQLAEITPGNLKKSFFTASGTEADETAVMMAMTTTGNSEFITLRHSYSGRSMLAQSMTAHSSWRSLPTQIASVKHALAPYCYRCPMKLKYPQCGVACARDVEELIQTTTTGQIAGMMVEPVMGVGGFITPPAEYIGIVSDIVHHYGGILISDEVQTGFGRTGKLWGIEQFDVTPDMMTMAKGIANGFPLGAVITTSEIADSLKKNSISTFGGNPVSCAAANATIKIILRDNIHQNCEIQGSLLRNGLEMLKNKYPVIVGDVRGMGLMQALELVVNEAGGDKTPNAKAAAWLMEETKNRGLLIGRGGLYGNVLRIAPPMNITGDEIETALSKLDDALKAIDTGLD